MPQFTFPSPPPSPEAEVFRAEIRDFLATELKDRAPIDRAQSWNGLDPAFSRKLGQRGWLGLTWPTAYGGHARSNLERYVLLEELLGAGAPVGAHWIAERQSGPSLLRYGTEAQKRAILPRIAAGECFFCIGMSEPDSGSDLASVRTRAVREDGGWRVNGTKLWTTNATHCHFMILFCRTAPADREHRHAGTSQFVVDLTLPGITIRPVRNLVGEHHFNEVVFEDALLPEDALLGQEGEGWSQVTGELAYERSGPERFLSSFRLLVELVRALQPAADERAAIALGRLAAQLVTLRRMSRSVAGLLQAGADPALEAAMVKDLGALVEQAIPEIARDLIAEGPPTPQGRAFAEVLAYTTLHAPSFSLRGGTREILRGIIARGLGLR
ncbi:acyl-CoA dehydrogenase family protein [Methylobacterium platani]|uniref:Acyl-CoA dehydrogenase n=2 Tax=Methylobacterium platani TaxID=427683 RepID=A0A179S0M8_9HYPH|nr:acyl-CoA dehydrogenase family protein [Methylobacterium platani]KMO13640.1 acyl-CoA dehydrogenase [Methylobacterium platani JCM 14648]OAS15873.1 acyl-CoA dehydrogenase [Methylobacterium platani]